MIWRQIQHILWASRRCLPVGNTLQLHRPMQLLYMRIPPSILEVILYIVSK